MITAFTNRDLMPIREAYLRMICESADDKNRKKAMKFADNWLTKHGLLGQFRTTSANGRELRDGKAVEAETAKAVKNAREMAKAKYMPGAVRMYLDLQMDERTRNEAGSDLGKLNQIVKLIASGHENEYDGNFNGMSFKELERRFATSVATALKKDMEEIGSRTYSNRSDYDIVRIPTFEDAEKYGRYTSWCVTHSEGAYDDYTHDGTGIFYFCLRKGFESVPRERGEGCPLDEYGKSMIAISVNDDGSLNTCTCRWNHDNGGNDDMMTTKEISDFFGVNFYETFKPRDPNELMERYRENSVEDAFADKMGWICVESEDDYGAYDYVMLSSPSRKYPTPRIVKCRKVVQLVSSAVNIVCIARDHFYWYDGNSGMQIQVPDSIDHDIDCENWPQLTSLEGCPRSIGKGTLNCSGCKNLESLAGIPQELGGLKLSECEKLAPDALSVIADMPLLVKRLLFGDHAKEFTMDSNGTASALVDFEDIESVYGDGYDELSWDFVRKLLRGDWLDLFYRGDYSAMIGDMEDCDFDKILSENGFDVTWKDISRLYDGITDAKFTEDQSEEILEMLNDDFCDGFGINEVYNDCEMNGMADDAYNTVVDEIFSKLYIDRKYGVQDNRVKVVLPRNRVIDCFRNYLRRGGNIFELIRMSDEYEGEVEKISVSEPYSGFSGFDERYWEKAVDGFAKRVVEVLSRPPKTMDAKGQTFFDFDSKYLDNPRNKPRS